MFDVAYPQYPLSLFRSPLFVLAVDNYSSRPLAVSFTIVPLPPCNLIHECPLTVSLWYILVIKLIYCLCNVVLLLFYCYVLFKGSNYVCLTFTYFLCSVSFMVTPLLSFHSFRTSPDKLDTMISHYLVSIQLPCYLIVLRNCERINDKMFCAACTTVS